MVNVFDIIGPVMIGPSSSHTAGALRIGRVSWKILGEDVLKADIGLAGSFAQTYRGHGTDRAIIAGLLGMLPDDERIRDSFSAARDRGLVFSITEIKIPKAHPNTARLHLAGANGKECLVQGASVGGGNILITCVNEMETSFTGNSDTLIIAHQDMPGMIAQVTSRMAEMGINIGNFKLNRPHRGFEAVMTLEIDGTMEREMVNKLRGLPHINSVVYLRANQNEGN
ncbi:MAG: L-serine ammonia-lyase, iron-sulfur-dependent subunit beta [Treponema sp.]|jgi:L-serine dehydratase|nr:L-serine ammonia-lyase, iron-sulfur-dependent subunit beta [Treponema sp.]